MGNKYFGGMSPEPYYIMGKGYKCQDDWDFKNNKYGCGKEFATRREYISHIVKEHTKKEASALINYQTYYKYFEPEKYQKYLTERKAYAEERKHNPFLP